MTSRPVENIFGHLDFLENRYFHFPISGLFSLTITSGTIFNVQINRFIREIHFEGCANMIRCWLPPGEHFQIIFLEKTQYLWQPALQIQIQILPKHQVQTRLLFNMWAPVQRVSNVSKCSQQTIQVHTANANANTNLRTHSKYKYKA